MITYTDKAQENKAITQQRLHDIANSRAQAHPLNAYQEIANNSPAAKQLKAYKAMAASCHSQTVQRKPVAAEVVWDVTHVVTEMNESLLGNGDFDEGEIGAEGELTAGQIITIDDEDVFVSRRGPNQENPTVRRLDQASKPTKEWYRVLTLNDKDVRTQNLYVRAETIHPYQQEDETDSPKEESGRTPEAGAKPIKIKKGESFTIKGLIDCVGVIIEITGEDFNICAAVGGHFVTPTMYNRSAGTFTDKGKMFIAQINELIQGISKDDLQAVFYIKRPAVKGGTSDAWVEAGEAAAALLKALNIPGGIQESSGVEMIRI